MGKFGFSRRSLTVTVASLAVAIAGLVVTTSAVARPQSIASGMEVSTQVPAKPDTGSPGGQSGEANSVDRKSPELASSRGDRPKEPQAQQPASPAPTPVPASDAKGPGLASPLPSQLESAAAAVNARYGPGRTIKVGIQAGHWKNAELPDELSMLKGSTGAMGVGWREVDVNLDVAKKVVASLAPFGVNADLLPATVPADYKADAFVAIHADANNNKTLTGFKVARASWSTIPQKDDALVASLRGSYQSATGLSWDAKTITDNMTEYYAFNHKLQHSVDSNTPSAILEMGFLTNAADQKLMLSESDRLAQSVALGILNFLAK